MGIGVLNDAAKARSKAACTPGKSPASRPIIAGAKCCRITASAVSTVSKLQVGTGRLCPQPTVPSAAVVLTRIAARTARGPMNLK